MRKLASCILSIALSLVMSVSLIPSPAFAGIDGASEPATQSASKPNEIPTETTSGQTQANDQISAASNTSSETPNQTPECSPSDINATSSTSPELARLPHAALPCGVVAISSRPPTGDTGLAGQDLLASVAVLVGFL